jgi:hypothetical protein
MSQNWTPPPAGGSATVPNYLVWAIIGICGCGWPLAIPAIIFATQVNNKIAAGDIAGAEEASKKAKMFAMIAVGLDILFWICMIIYVVFIVGIAATAGNR